MGCKMPCDTKQCLYGDSYYWNLVLIIPSLAGGRPDTLKKYSYLRGLGSTFYRLDLVDATFYVNKDTRLLTPVL